MNSPSDVAAGWSGQYPSGPSLLNAPPAPLALLCAPAGQAARITDALVTGIDTEYGCQSQPPLQA